ncbi:MAG: hypothetical protein JNK87_10195 [Bryobacterales bacterium]|nr:hypothetical protein [Bryobacterales bacterium]
MTADVGRLFAATAEWLRSQQYQRDGDCFVRGEFPMQLTGPVSGVDHNFLSGYALLHAATAIRTGALPDGVAAVTSTILQAGRDLPRAYQSAAGTGNWYKDYGDGLHGPCGYSWPGGLALSLRDDYDDTAVAALLGVLGHASSVAPHASLFDDAVFDPDRHRLVPKSQRRLEITGVERNVYMSWVLSHPAPPRHDGTLRILTVPDDNSVELTTAANIYTALHALGADPQAAAQRGTRRFVNRLLCHCLGKLREGDASYMDFASSYYPRVPFAPVAFLLRNEWLTGGALLEDATRTVIAGVLLHVDPHAGWRSHGFANAAYWLNSAAWAVLLGLVDAGSIGGLARSIWLHLLSQRDDSAPWPDIEFFHGAHLGNYSGRPYAAAFLLETMAVLRAAELL